MKTKRTSEFVLRAYDPSTDLDCCEQLYLEMRRQTFVWIRPQRFRLDDFSRDIRGETIGIADHPEHGIIGFVGVWLPDNFIHHLYVSTEWHRLGAGRALLDYGLALVGRPARLKCQAANSNARSFYEHLGWIEGESGRDAIGQWIEYILD